MTNIGELTEFQQRACALALVKMLSAKSFNICVLDAIGKTMGRTSSLAGKDYDALRAIHCVDWADMGPELATLTRAKCFELLGLAPQDIPVGSQEAGAAPAKETARRLRLAFWKQS